MKRSNAQLFRKTTNKGKQYSIRNSLGVYQAMCWYRKHRPKDKDYILTPGQFYSIIREVNNAVVRDFIASGEIMFPLGMGKVTVADNPTGVYTKNGKTVINYPIDWDSTLHLWETDKESREQKRLVRFNVDTCCKIIYNPLGGYTNCRYFIFKENTFMRRALRKAVSNKSITIYERYKMIN